MPVDQVYLSDLASLVKRRKILSLSIFLLVLFSAVVFQLKIFRGYHVQQNMVVRNVQSQSLYDHILKLRSLLSSDPFILNKIIEKIPDAHLSAYQLQMDMLSVKILSLGSTMTDIGIPTEMYRMGLFVRSPDKNLAKRILSLWTPLAIEEIQRLTRGMQRRIDDLQDRIKVNRTLAKETSMGLSKNFTAQEIFLKDDVTATRISRIYNDLEQSRLQMIQSREENRRRNRPFKTFYLEGRVRSYEDALEKIFLYEKAKMDRLPGVLKEIMDAETEIVELRAKLLQVEAEPNAEVTFSEKHRLWQMAVVSLVLALIVTILAVSSIEALQFSIRKF